MKKSKKYTPFEPQKVGNESVFIPYKIFKSLVAEMKELKKEIKKIEKARKY